MMVLINLRTVLITVVILHASRGSNWSSVPQDGAFEYACTGGSVTLPWQFNLSSGHTIHDIQWFYSGQSQELVALFSHGAFVPLPAFSNRVQFVANAGLRIDNLVAADSGNYSAEVSWTDDSGKLLSLRRSVYVQVKDELVTGDEDLQMTQNPAAVLDATSNQWTIELRCGNFTFRDQPPFDLQWVSPSGRVSASNEYRDGQFFYLLPTPVTGGNYTCRVSAQSADVCLPADIELSLGVDAVSARLAILEARQTASEAQQAADKAQLQAENDLLKQQLAEAHLNLSHLQDLSSRRVSFQAWHLSNITEPSQRMIIKDVITNQGNAYDSKTGYFTAPFNGTYFFAATSGPSSTEAGHWGGIYLFVDHRELARTGAQDEAIAEAATLHVSVHLLAGQQVWMRAQGVMSYWSTATMFSGFLVSPDP